MSLFICDGVPTHLTRQHLRALGVRGVRAANDHLFRCVPSADLSVPSAGYCGVLAAKGRESTT